MFLLNVRSSQSKQTKQLFTLKTDILANTFQKSPLQLKRVTKLCCYGNFIYKGKMNKRNNKILINAGPIWQVFAQNWH